MKGKIDTITHVASQAGAAVAVTPFLTLSWWNENSAGIVAICAVVGAAVSVVSFIINQWHKGNVQRMFKRK